MHYFGFTVMLSMVVELEVRTERLSDVVVADAGVFALSQDAAITTNTTSDAK